MLFKYKAITKDGKETEGSIDAVSKNSAIKSLQKRGLIISEIKKEDDSWYSRAKEITFFNTVSIRDMVIVSQQISILFESHISALRVFKLLSIETENDILKKVFTEVSSDIQDGNSISDSLSKHPEVFSSFYVNMVSAGEESGKLNQTFRYLSQYLERTHELISKAKNALIYPAFIIVVFIAVLTLIFTFIIPQISEILMDAGEELPIYTKAVIYSSNFIVDYGIFLLGLILAGLGTLIWWVRTDAGSYFIDSFKLSIPFIGVLYKKLYLARIADTLTTLISGGVSITRSLEISSRVVDNQIYKEILEDSVRLVKDGMPLSEAFSKHEEIPTMMVQMLKVSEEGGAVGDVLNTLSSFYQKEVSNYVDTLMSMIEPIMMILLGILVGFLLASVLIPIYNVAGGVAF